MAAATRVDLIAQPTQAALAAPKSNPALDLAGALADTSTDARRFLLGFADKQRAKQEAKAKADALANSGTAFADAVRSGNIVKTQNPWYIAQYQRDSAQIATQSAVAKIIEDSQTWAERTDPAKYNERLNAEIGKVAETFTQPDQAQGFRAAAAPLLQQSLQSNVAYNVQRIQQEHVANASALTVGDILKAVSDNGGKPTAEQVYAAIEPRHQEWLATGNTEADWQQLTVNAVIAAGTNAGLPDLLDVLQKPNGKNPPLANIAGPDGTPVAATLLTMKYRIQQDADDKATREVRELKLATQVEGEKALGLFWKNGTMGSDFLSGKTPKADIITFLADQKVSPQAIQYALNALSEDASANNALSRALMGANGGPILQMYSDARSKGWSPALQSQVEKAVRDGTMDYNEGEQILNASWGKTDQINSEARSDQRQAQSEARADARDRRQELLQAQVTLKTGLQQTLGAGSVALQSVGINDYTRPDVIKQVQLKGQQAMDASLKAKPGDYDAAQAAADKAINDDMNARIAKRKKKPAGASAPAGNPRGTR